MKLSRYYANVFRSVHVVFVEFFLRTRILISNVIEIKAFPRSLSIQKAEEIPFRGVFILYEKYRNVIWNGMIFRYYQLYILCQKLKKEKKKIAFRCSEINFTGVFLFYRALL